MEPDACATGCASTTSEPVLAKDVVASIRRFAPRVIFADRADGRDRRIVGARRQTVRFRLKRPFPHLPEALAGPGGNVPAIMPERLAQESPFKPVAEIVGSGPFRFLKDEHVSGARAVFARFAEYQPRDGGDRWASPPGRRWRISIGSSG